MLLSTRFTAYHEDGSTTEGEFDQRDVVAFELEFGRAINEVPTLYVRYSAWHALKRTGREPGPWAKWTATCIAVNTVAGREAEGEQRAHPGLTAQSAEA